jgi:hypothetical protein
MVVDQVGVRLLAMWVDLVEVVPVESAANSLAVERAQQVKAMLVVAVFLALMQERVAVAVQVVQVAVVLVCPQVVMVVLDYNLVLLVYQHTMLAAGADQAVVQVGWAVVEQQQQHLMQHQLVVHQTRAVVEELDLVMVDPEPPITTVRLVVQGWLLLLTLQILVHCPLLTPG